MLFFLIFMKIFAMIPFKFSSTQDLKCYILVKDDKIHQTSVEFHRVEFRFVIDFETEKI